ncbi:hypothetical protein ACWC98_36330 [Streptomyces goshikiensis]|uniref:hypothetical protein n=1 Tax=Streptomyces goshikiensis TaxID=1942 RepID=UPI0036B5EB0B
MRGAAHLLHRARRLGPLQLRHALVLGELSHWAFSDPEALADEQPAPIETALLQRRGEAASAEAAALHGPEPSAPSGPRRRSCFRLAPQ